MNEKTIEQQPEISKVFHIERTIVCIHKMYMCSLPYLRKLAKKKCHYIIKCRRDFSLNESIFVNEIYN